VHPLPVQVPRVQAVAEQMMVPGLQLAVRPEGMVQPKLSAVPDPVQLPLHALFPAATHLLPDTVQSESCEQMHVWPAAVHAPPATLHLPLEHEYVVLFTDPVGMPGLARAHWKPSAVPLPEQLVHERSFFPDAEMHLPLGHWESAVQ
jgi:hypothetical protein